jgi:geranylgeranyl reductase family protein
MSMTNLKIIIIGAGPVGCYLGQLLSRDGFSPLLIEEDAEVGRPVRCAGIVGRGVFEDLEIKPDASSILNEIHGAEISFRNFAFDIGRRQVAYIVDRAKFDRNLGAGLKVQTGTKFLSFSKSGKHIKIKTSRGDFDADILVGADGPNSRVRKAARLRGEVKLHKGLQYRIEGQASDLQRVLVHFIRPFHEFAWIIPEGNGILRVGVISSRPHLDLEVFIRQHGLRGRVIEKNGGLIPIGRVDLCNKNVAVVGDAAAQVKPITSGGIYYGMRAAEMLAKAIREGDLSQYPKNWQAQFGQEIAFCLLARGVMESINAKTQERIFNYMQDNAHLIEQLADFENHSSVIWGLAANPQTYATIGLTAFDLFKNPKFIRGTFSRLRHLVFR